MGYKQVTRKDVAREANVSETIVSYVMNNNRYVDKEKRKRVEEAVKKLGYRPNNIARALKGKKLNHIIFVADQIVTEHFSLLMNEIDKYAYDLGYMVSLCANRNDEQFVQSIISRCFDGVIISSISFPLEYIQELIDANIPVVLLENRDYDSIRGAAKISTGLYEGAKESVYYLYRNGCRNFVYLDRFSENNHFSSMKDMRYRGFVEAIRELGLHDDPTKLVLTNCHNENEVRAAVTEYLSLHKVDAIFGRNDKLACIGMQAAQGAGYRIPEDIRVIGFDNSMISQYTVPPITSMEIRREEIAFQAVKMLQQMIDESVIPQKVELSTVLIERESTVLVERKDDDLPERESNALAEREGVKEEND